MLQRSKYYQWGSHCHEKWKPFTQLLIFFALLIKQQHSEEPMGLKFWLLLLFAQLRDIFLSFTVFCCFAVGSIMLPKEHQIHAFLKSNSIGYLLYTTVNISMQEKVCCVLLCVYHFMRVVSIQGERTQCRVVLLFQETTCVLAAHERCSGFVLAAK